MGEERRDVGSDWARFRCSGVFPHCSAAQGIGMGGVRLKSSQGPTPRRGLSREPRLGASTPPSPTHPRRYPETWPE